MSGWRVGAALLMAVPAVPLAAQTEPADAAVARLVAAMLGDTPLLRDLRTLTVEIGGRATGSAANRRAVAWALDRFEDAGVAARAEPFQMESLWLERSASAVVEGEGIGFAPRIAAMPFSAATPPDGAAASLLDGGAGSAEDFARLGVGARGAFVLVETPLLLDVPGLFREYGDAFAVERRAVEAGAGGVVYMGSRPPGILHRHNSSLRGDEARPMMVMERTAARRALTLLRAGRTLTLRAVLDLDIGGSYRSHNVVGEIRGSSRPEEVVVVGAHLDSWDLGGGALDNGANVALVIDVARQIRRLGLRPARTIRFALWNGEEQGLQGSYGYTREHAAELDDHVMAMSFDIGCGRITGFFTGGRPEIAEAVQRVLAPVAGLGPFTSIDVPVVGTDNFDFMMHGIANLVGNQESARYGPNYHAASDQIAQCDPGSLRVNAAIVAAVTYGFATGDVTWSRQSREEIDRLLRTTDLEQQMRTFNVWEGWAAGVRGRQP